MVSLRKPFLAFCVPINDIVIKQRPQRTYSPNTLNSDPLALAVVTRQPCVHSRLPLLPSHRHFVSSREPSCDLANLLYPLVALPWALVNPPAHSSTSRTLSSPVVRSRQSTCFPIALLDLLCTIVSCRVLFSISHALSITFRMFSSTLLHSRQLSCPLLSFSTNLNLLTLRLFHENRYAYNL